MYIFIKLNKNIWHEMSTTMDISQLAYIHVLAGVCFQILLALTQSTMYSPFILPKNLFSGITSYSCFRTAAAEAMGK